MPSPNWNGFFPHGIYGGIAFWVNLAILMLPVHDAFGFTISDKYVAGYIVIFTIVVLLSGYIIEQISFFSMKVFATPVKWYYNFTIEFIREKSGGVSQEITTPEDAEIEYDENIDVGWRNRGTIALINTQIALGIFLSWIVIITLVLPDKKNYPVFLFFLIIPCAAYLANILIDAFKRNKLVACSKDVFKRILKGSGWRIFLHGLLLSFVAVYLLLQINRIIPIKDFAGADILSFDMSKVKGAVTAYYKLVGIIEAIVTFILIYEANSINKIYGRYLAQRGDPKAREPEIDGIYKLICERGNEK